MVKDWTKISQKYKGMWVALKDDQVTVIASDKTLQKTLEKAKQKGFPNPAVTRMPDENISFAGAF